MSNICVEIAPNIIKILPAKINPTIPSIKYNPQLNNLLKYSLENKFNCFYSDVNCWSYIYKIFCDDYVLAFIVAEESTNINAALSTVYAWLDNLNYNKTYFL